MMIILVFVKCGSPAAFHFPSFHEQSNSKKKKTKKKRLKDLGSATTSAHVGSVHELAEEEHTSCSIVIQLYLWFELTKHGACSTFQKNYIMPKHIYR